MLRYSATTPLLREARLITGGCDPSDPLLAGLSEKSGGFILHFRDSGDDGRGLESSLDRRLSGLFFLLFFFFELI